jgi:hypothetical protein
MSIYSSEYGEHDPRLDPLSQETQLLITARFGGDVDLATDYAHHANTELADPPHWVHELVMPRTGWKHRSQQKFF